MIKGKRSRIAMTELEEKMKKHLCSGWAAEKNEEDEEEGEGLSRAWHVPS